MTNRPAPSSPPVATAAAPPSPGNSPIGLDGYCPVRLAEKKAWTRGDRRWEVIHQGRTYLFTGPEEMQRFYKEPDRYAPVNLGNDVVLAVEQNQTVSGCREHGVFFDGKVYLFAGEASLQKFSTNPIYYAGRALQASRNGALVAQPVR
jgi:YHS domain-containing protein